MQNYTVENLEDILQSLLKVKEHIISNSIEHSGQNWKSLANLYDYVHLRKLDLTTLQNKLTNIGLSSLGRSQSCVLNSINQTLFVVSKLLDKEHVISKDDYRAINFDQAKSIQLTNNKIFGKDDHTSYTTKIMVTLPSEAKDSPELIRELIKAGVSIFRINTAHDDKFAWNKMAEYIKEENISQNSDTKIYVDLAGPKNRTTKIVREFIPFKIGSRRLPTEVEIVSSESGGFTKKASKDSKGNVILARLVVDDDFFNSCKLSNQITIDDLEREKAQRFTITHRDGRIFIIANKRVYVYESTKLHLEFNNTMETCKLHNFEYLPEKIRLFKNNEIVITNKTDVLGKSGFELDGKRYSAIIGCSNKEIFQYVTEGDEIFIDDGKIGCIVTGKNSFGLECKITLAKDNGTILKEEKGINFPSTDLEISAITPEDERNFEDIVEFADIIGLSFAQTKEDILKLQEMLTKKDKANVGIVPKIETKMAMDNLPQILSSLIRWKSFALMIARGDLAIEVGFDNLPHIQEEIFDICESAHVPVIYATQILEGKMKSNLPSRAEVTDAASSQRADCVMLNKGPYVVDTVIAMKNILRSAHRIFQKNRQLLNTYDKWTL